MSCEAALQPREFLSTFSRPKDAFEYVRAPSSHGRRVLIQMTKFVFERAERFTALFVANEKLTARAA